MYGIELWLHWTLLIWFAYVFYGAWVSPGRLGGGETILRTIFWWFAIFGSILFHEMGHCYAASRQGGGADAIVLWPLGGLAYCDAPHLPRNQFWVAAGGPLFQLIPMAAAGALILGFNVTTGPFPHDGSSYLAMILGALFYWNLIILIFNLIPIYALDGGRMLQALLWGKSQSYGRATLITVWTSRISIFICAFLALFFLRDYYLPVLIILLWQFFETERLRIRLLSGEENEDDVFGYDFSRGYTSLERTTTRERPKRRASFFSKLRARSRAKRELQEAETKKRVDILLDKISREGMQSLTRGERRFLEQASKKYQGKDG